MYELSKKGVLFLTSGFQQYYTLQNIAHIIQSNNHQNSPKSLKIILSDGQIYISGVYNIKNTNDLEKCEKIRQYDLLRVFAQYQGGTKPIIISSLEIISTGHQGIYGMPPISLKDYMQSRLLKKSIPAQKVERNANINNFCGKQKHQSFIDSEKITMPQVQKHLFQTHKKNEQISEVYQQQDEKKNLSFELSNQENEYDLLKDINEVQSKKRDQRTFCDTQVLDNPHKRLKPNQQQHEEGQIFIKNVEKTTPTQKSAHQGQQNIELQTKISHKVYQKNNSLSDIKSQNTQRIQIKKIKQIQVIDLDSEPTQKQSIEILTKSNKRQYRQSDLKFIEEILKSDEKQTQKNSAFKKPQEGSDSFTIPKSQTLIYKNVSTPAKLLDPSNKNEQAIQQVMGSTTEKKKIRQEYNLLIENLYESNTSFKIICRVNSLYEWRSKNGNPCLALDLMDSKGDEIKAIVYMNHASQQCKQCKQMVQVGKVYCFQNGQCRRDFIQKQALQLVFNLRVKPIWSKQVECGGKNKIIPAPKIKIQALFQNKVQSISQIISLSQSGKNNLTNVYGIMQSFKFNQFGKKATNNQKDKVQEQEEKSDPEIELIELQSSAEQNIPLKKSNGKTLKKQGPTSIYLNGFLADPIQRKKIAFGCILTKPIGDNQNMGAEQFLQKNGIKKGALLVLHNVRVQSTNENTVHKIQKTKRTYMQVVKDCSISQWQYNRAQFGSETVSLNQIDDNTPLYPSLKQILSFTQKEIDSIMENPRVVNYSKQPFTERSIFQLNQLVEKSMMPQQSCFSEIKNVKIHSIDQKPSVDICFYCKKKAKSPEQKSNTNSHGIKHCQRCKMIVKTITMHIFNIVFADDTSSFLVEVVKNEYLETLLGVKIEDYLSMQDDDQKDYLNSIKYTEFIIKLRSEKKIDGVIHKINSIEKMPIKARIQEIKSQKKGLPKHYKRLDSSW